MKRHPAPSRILLAILAALAVLASATGAAGAAKPGGKAAVWPPPVSEEEMKLDKQVREIAVGLRAPCCPELTLAQHDSPLTLEMKRYMKDLLRAGKSKREVVSALEGKYGKGIYAPISAASWKPVVVIASPFLLLIGIVVALHVARRRRPEVLHLEDSRWAEQARKKSSPRRAA